MFAPTDSEALVFVYDYAFNGIAPTSDAPWLTATFEQSGTSAVSLVFQSSLEVESEFFTQIGFNLRPEILPSAVTISCRD